MPLIHRCIILAFSLLTLSLFAGPTTSHVFIISIDGGKPSVIRESAMPVLSRLINEGAHTWEATTTMPSLTLPSHASMLTGVEPAKHKILWNDWNPKAGTVTVPTVFSAAQSAGLLTAMFVGKEKFMHLVRTGSVNHFSYHRERFHEVFTPIAGTDQKERSISVGAKVVAEDAAGYIREKRPNLCFIHLTDPDDAGHEHGWGSPQQRRAFQRVDAAIGVILEGIERAGITQNSIVIVTADHGGHGHEHGSNLPDDMKVPWIVWGKHVRRGMKIDAPVTTCDTAATALWLLGIPLPKGIDGKPNLAAFEHNSVEQARSNTGE